MHAVVAFAKPFRMPDFFMISGLFLARVIDRDWRDLSRPQGRALRLFLRAVGDDPVRLQGAGCSAAEQGWAGVAAQLSRILHRAVRHAVVHLPAADLLCRHQADPPGVPVAGRAGCVGAGAGDGARSTTGWTVIDEFAASLRVFLHGLYLLAELHLRARRAAVDKRGQDCALSVAGCCGRWSTALVVLRGLGRLARCISLRAGRHRRRRGGHGLGTDDEQRQPVRGASRYCGKNSIVIYLAFFVPVAIDARRAAQDRHHHRRRHGLADRHDRRAWSARWSCSGACAARPAPLPVRAAGHGRASSSSGPRPRRCSRRNRFRRPFAHVRMANRTFRHGDRCKKSECCHAAIAARKSAPSRECRI